MYKLISGPFFYTELKKRYLINILIIIKYLSRI